MELVQWIVPRDDGSLTVGWAPLWADRIASFASDAGKERRPVRRRGAPLVSRWLPFPLAVGVPDDAAHGPGVADEAARPLPVPPGSLVLAFAFALDVDGARPVVGGSGDDLRFAGLFGELVRVAADLAEAAGLPAQSITPTNGRRGFELVVGALGSRGLMTHVVADALVLVRAALETCAQARGLQLTDAHVRLEAATDAEGPARVRVAPIDGRVAGWLAG